MTVRPACTVIIPTYNRATLLGYTLASLARQSLPADRFEVMVVDDGSSDPTRAVVESFAGRLNLRYFFQPDQGFRAAKARNTGIVQATADVCVFVDCGMLLHSGCLAAHLASHTAATDRPVGVCGYIYCFTLDNEEAGQLRRVIDVDDPDGTIARLDRTGRWLDLREEFYARYTDQFHDLPAPWLVFWTGNSSAQTGQLHRIGRFDEAFTHWGGEDVDLGYRLHRDGAKLVTNRQARSIHYPHPKRLADNLEHARDSYRYLAEKYDTPITRMLAAENFDEDYFRINEIILERGLPRCADYLAARAGRAHGAPR